MFGRGAAALGVLLLAATVAAASVPDERGSFTGCVHDQTGNLRVIDPATGQDCQPKERRITWNEEGLRGPQGPPGPAGSLTSLEQLEGLSCAAGAGVVDLAIGPEGTVSLRCAPVVGPPPPPPTGCGLLSAFDPRATPAYDDYPINGETADNQYRSFLRGELVRIVQSAAQLVLEVASGSTTGHGAPIGLGDMSECDGSIPGTSTGDPGHPRGTHTGGNDIDIAYYQTGTPDNHLRAVCETTINRVEQNHCVAAPDRLDAHRTALFLEALASSGALRLVVVDGQIGPVLETELSRLCAERVTDCSQVPLAYEVTDQGQGLFLFHQHQMHVSFQPPAR